MRSQSVNTQTSAVCVKCLDKLIISAVVWPLTCRMAARLDSSAYPGNDDI